MRYQGKIITWKDDKGFGFIISKVDKKEVFVHIKSFVNRQRRPVGNELVSYEIKTDNKGRPQAVKVLFDGEDLPVDSISMHEQVSVVFLTIFMFFLVIIILIGKLPKFILWFYLLSSFITFFAYLFDKSSAQNNQWRTPESTLHLFSLIGGWPGALVAQIMLRHKSIKQSFQFEFWVTVIINCSALGYLFSRSGEKLLHSITEMINRSGIDSTLARILVIT